MGRILTLSRLRVQSTDTQAIIEDLTQLTIDNPNLKQGLPVIIESHDNLDLAWLVRILKKTGLQVLGVADGVLSEQARQIDLPILPPDHTQPRPIRNDAPKAAPGKPNVPPPPGLPARILTDPVRSGQQIYAEKSDLILMAPVSAGAEVIADGSIHVYSSLRGRAIAGAAGNPAARIFCRKMEAELIAIAGVYMVSEQIPTQFLGKATQSWLSDDSRLEIQLLDF